jgi:hypothetical protein
MRGVERRRLGRDPGHPDHPTVSVDGAERDGLGQVIVGTAVGLIGRQVWPQHGLAQREGAFDRDALDGVVELGHFSRQR